MAFKAERTGLTRCHVLETGRVASTVEWSPHDLYPQRREPCYSSAVIHVAGGSVTLTFKWLLSSAGFLMLLFATGCATTPPSPPVKPAPLFTTAEYVQERQRTGAPFAHVVFCSKYQEECISSGDRAAVALSPARMEELAAVNSEVNAQIIARDDPLEDTWTLFPRTGDCEDFVVSKRHELIARGWPASALRLAIGTTSTNEGHMVLVARTDQGDFVLDNRVDHVQRWRDADLSWKSIQSSTDPRIWYKT